LAQNVEDLAHILRCFWDIEVYKQAPIRSRNVYYLPRPWNDAVFTSNRKRRIGLMTQIDILPVSAATHRALDEAKQALEAMGHEVVPFTISN
jgi:Asp-tRNA(Asn)/Glu-tRNA(Gln) amidotransferase A subunit family amidase